MAVMTHSRLFNSSRAGGLLEYCSIIIFRNDYGLYTGHVAFPWVQFFSCKWIMGRIKNFAQQNYLYAK